MTFAVRKEKIMNTALSESSLQANAVVEVGERY
jgi:hypothetical protein